MPIITVNRYAREDLQNNRHAVYVFGDNMARWGRGGQAAACRDEPNTIGIPTLWEPGRFFVDDDFDKVKATIDAEFTKIRRLLRENIVVVFPQDGVGTGLGRLKETAPEIFKYVQDKWANAKQTPRLIESGLLNSADEVLKYELHTISVVLGLPKK